MNTEEKRDKFQQLIRNKAMRLAKEELTKLITIVEKSPIAAELLITSTNAVQMLYVVLRYDNIKETLNVEKAVEKLADKIEKWETEQIFEHIEIERKEKKE